MTFMDDYHAGRTDGFNIEVYIDDWHHQDPAATPAVPLHAHLGMTPDEYRDWFYDHTLPERGAP